MHKYKLICPIRRINPYKQMAREMRTNSVSPNVLNREFLLHGPRKVLLTDITYLHYRGGKCCYLSTILDALTCEILSYMVSESFEVGFVIETVDMLIEVHGAVLDNETIVHSDQGCHYMSRAFIAALQESFFGHMKDEIADEISKMSSFAEVHERVADWIEYYNNDRYQWDLLKLSPSEYYEYTKTGIYPLKKCTPPSSWGSAPNPEV